MKKYKKIVILILTFFITIQIFCLEEDLAKVNLKKAYSYFKNNQFDFARETLQKSYQFAKNIPEYYYISNLLLSEEKSNLNLKEKNAEKVFENLNRMFFIEKYDLLKQSALIFEKNREFKKSFDTYEKIFQIEGIDLENDYLNCIKMLFYSNITSNISQTLDKAFKKFENPDLYYYSLLNKILYKKITLNDFNKDLNLLIAAKYSQSKILYLKILFNTNKSKIFTEYLNLKNNNLIETEFIRQIIFSFLDNPKSLTQKQILSLLNDWVDNNGVGDYKTNIIISRNVNNTIIKANKTLSDEILNYTGVRLKDEDKDGNWEEYNEYQNGFITNKIVDTNQDGINEYEAKYLTNGKINELVKYTNITTYEKYILNEIDNSVESIEYYKNNELNEIIKLLRSKLFLKSDDLLKITKESALPYFDTKEYIGEEHSITKYHQGKIEYQYIDENNNGKFNYKKYFVKGIVNNSLKDINNDGYYDIKEIYVNGKVSEIYTRSDENYSGYDYLEKIKDNETNKFWDLNQDGIFEVEFRELKNGTYYKLFDVNFDSQYDFVLETKNKIPQKLYEIQKGKWILIKNYPQNSNIIQNNWSILSMKKTENIIVPDKIEISNKTLLNGVYYFKNEKKYFEKGFLKNHFFNYKLFIINDLIYLLDLLR